MLISIIGDLLPENPFLRLLLDGVSLCVLMRKPLETLTAHAGTPIGLRSNDVAVYFGSCLTSIEGSEVLQDISFLEGVVN
jgi:hypothetical protein